VKNVVLIILLLGCWPVWAIAFVARILYAAALAGWQSGGGVLEWW